MPLVLGLLTFRSLILLEIYFAYGHPVTICRNTKNTLLSHITCSWHPFQNHWLHLQRFVTGNSVLAFCSVCLFLWHYHYYDHCRFVINFKTRNVSTPIMFFFFKTFLTPWRPSEIHMHFRMHCLISVKKGYWNFGRDFTGSVGSLISNFSLTILSPAHFFPMIYLLEFLSAMCYSFCVQIFCLLG